MAVINFRPEIWAANLLESLKKDHVLASVANRNYEGLVQAAGQSVRITSISRPTVNDYAGSVTYEELNDAQQILFLDQKNYFAFKVDDVDKKQAAGDFVPMAMQEASYAMRDDADLYLASLYTQAAAANVISTTAVTDGDKAYTMLKDLMVKLDQSNASRAVRWAVVTPWFHGLLLTNDKFVDYSASNSLEPLYNGRVGRALGFEIYVSNNLTNTTGDDWTILAGSNQAITYAEQLLTIEAGRHQASFGDYVRGLMIYGAKVVHPGALAYGVASIT
jgi:P22 coat protein - gene protein 5.